MPRLARPMGSRAIVSDAGIPLPSSIVQDTSVKQARQEGNEMLHVGRLNAYNI